MIIGKNETPEVNIRPFLYHQKSSFFSLEDFISQNNEIYETPSMLSEDKPSKTIVPPIVTTNTITTLPQLSSCSDRNREGLISDWPRIVNEQIHLIYLKKQQTEQLKPFFLTKSKFLSRIAKGPSNPISRPKAKKNAGVAQVEQVVVREETKEELVEVVEVFEEPNDKVVGSEALTEDIVVYTAEEIELINESQEKCNSWLEKHVLKFWRVKPSFTL